MKRKNKKAANPNKILSKKKLMLLQSNQCRSCGCILTEEYGKPNSITIQHNSPKNYHNYNTNTSLWCFKCNSDDNIWKNKYQIFGIDGCIRYLSRQEKHAEYLSGIWIIDWKVYYLKNNKLVSTFDYLDWRITKFHEWLKLHIDSNLKNSFEEWLSSLVTGYFSLRNYHIGGGWYCLSNPRKIRLWTTKFRTIEEQQKEEEEEEEYKYLFDILINQIY